MTKTTTVVRKGSITGGGSGEMRYKGVRKREWGKWVSEIRLPNSRERIWLGSYDAPEKAARAFDAAVLCLRGKKATGFNFPDDIPTDILIGRDDRSPMTSSEIQLAATRFAHSSSSSSVSLSSTSAGENSSTISPSEKELSTSEISSEDTMATADSGVDGGLDWLFLESFFGGDNFYTDFIVPPLPVDFGEENFSQSFLLWDF